MLQQGLCYRLNSHLLYSRMSTSIRQTSSVHPTLQHASFQLSRESLWAVSFGFLCTVAFVPGKFWQKQLCQLERCRHELVVAETGTAEVVPTTCCLCMDDHIIPPPCWGVPQHSWYQRWEVIVSLTAELFSSWFSLYFFFPPFPFLLFELGFIEENEEGVYILVNISLLNSSLKAIAY